jgi:molecular chaperone GrpE
MDNSQPTDTPVQNQEAVNSVEPAQNEDSPESFDTLSGSEKTETQLELKKLQDELAEAKDKYLRLYSEFENFRRRTAKEKLELIQGANEQLIRSILPVVDDFERAEKAAQGVQVKELEGFLLIGNKFRKTLEQSGAKAMPTEAGAAFDPDLHDAITQVPSPNESLKGKIVDVVEKGYLLNEKVIRHAKVVVGQ